MRAIHLDMQAPDARPVKYDKATTYLQEYLYTAAVSQSLLFYEFYFHLLPLSFYFPRKYPLCCRS